jgi:hypothetical protein
MRRLTREDVARAADLPTIEVEAPAWGGTLCLRSISAGQRAAYEEKIADDNFPQSLIVPTFLVLTIVDAKENGKQLFSDADLAMLAGKSSKATLPIYSAAAVLNGMRPLGPCAPEVKPEKPKGKD